MILAYLLLLTGLTISAVAIYYSVVGLTAIFSAAAIPIIIMGASLEIAKLVCASWLKANWERAPRFMKLYMTTAVIVLMLITSMGIFGFLSKAHNDQSLVSGDVQAKIAVFDEKIKVEKDTITTDRKALAQMDASVDQIMSRSTDEKGASKASALRQSQAKERTRLLAEIDKSNKTISALNEQRAPIAAENRKVEAEVGPIKYIAKFIYGEHGADENMLEKSVTWIIILIVIVFDPLAVIMLLAAQMTIQWHRKPKDEEQLIHKTVPIDETPVTGIVAQEVAQIIPEAVISREPDDELSQEDIKRIAEAVRQVKPKLAEQINELVEHDEPEIPMPIEQWNQMIAEAEKVAEAEQDKKFQILPELQEHIDTVEERIARGDSYIDTEGTEVALDNESKKKTYMIKDSFGRTLVQNRD
jgi:hypothetical protein